MTTIQYLIIQMEAAKGLIKKEFIYKLKDLEVVSKINCFKMRRGAGSDKNTYC